MSSGKGTIPYEMINSFDSLYITPVDGDDFFKLEDFHSSIKNSVISVRDYASVKKFYTLMKRRNLGDLNTLYNFQDMTILCEIFESRASFLNEKFKFNLRKCNSAGSFSGCVQCKCLIALSTKSEHVMLFEKTLIGGFSCVNTRLAFDASILLPNKNDPSNEKIENLKIIYNLKIGCKYKKKRFVSKILKMEKVTSMEML